MKMFKRKIAAALLGIMAFFGVGVGVGAPTPASAETVVVETETTTETTTENSPETNENETVEDLPTAGEETEEKGEITLDDILEFAGGLAEEAGVGDEWAKAVENLKNAASEKKVDIMTGVSIGQLCLLAAYVIGKLCYAGWKKHKDTTAKDVKDMKATTGKQTKAVNELIGQAETVAENVAEASERERKLAIAGQEQNAALRCLFRGVNFNQAIKDEALRHLNNSDQYYDEAKS